jgi:Ca2+-binding RTX toxin-like protein
VDVILVSDGENTVLGGFGGDQITGGVDRDVVVGDNGNATFTDAGVLTFITTSEPAIGGDDVILAGSGDNTVLGGIGADEITGGNGRDVVIGDNGNATFDMTGVLLLARTSDPTVPGSYNDVIFTGNGFNTVLAGNGNDRVTGGNGRDVVIGDNGVATFDNVAGISLLREILSTDTAIGGDDTIAAGDGRNVMIGGFGKDLMTSGVDDDIAVGDNGHAFFSVGGVMTYITTISPEIGDIDTIDVSDGDNTVIGGFQGDFITSGSGRDVILGDNGNATFNDNDVLTYITTTEPSIGGVDVIDAGDGDNVVIGGQTGDIINSGNGRDVVIGDNGYAEFNAAARLTFVTTTDPAIGGDDLINAGDGDNVVLAGFGADEVTTGLHDDIVVGDNGYAIFNSSGILTYVTTTEPEIGGDDLIDAGDGRNIVLAGYGSDRVTSGSGQDVVVGDNGYAVFDDSGPLTFITTTSPEIGGDDAIETGAEEDIVFGGQGADTIGSGAGADLVLGDNGYAEFDASGSPTFITTTDFGIGGNDLVFAGSGNDLVIGGTGDDEIYGEVGHDTLIGDQAYWSDELTTPRFVELLDETLPGDDRIYGGDGMDLILSGGGDDWNEGGNDNDAIFTGYGNDFLWGGEGRDRLTGGPDGDWIDGGFGGDFIYVDVFDTWATGFPQDTVIMGRMTTTGLLFSDDLIRNYGDAGAGDSAACNVIWSMERLLESGRASIVPVSMDGFWSGSSPILKNNVMEALLESGYDSVRWGGDGSSILRLSMDRVGVPRLIGIGDFIEQHWYDLLPLYN